MCSIIQEFDDYPVTFGDITVYPEYYINGDNICDILPEENGKLIIAGIGKTGRSGYTSVVVGRNGGIFGTREKISIFTGEDSLISPMLNAIDYKDLRIGIVICKEVLHTCIAEVYRMMNVNFLACCIGGGSFWGLQRESWIDQMILFSDIVKAPMVVCSGASKIDGGINMIINK